MGKQKYAKICSMSIPNKNGKELFESNWEFKELFEELIIKTDVEQLEKEKKEKVLFLKKIYLLRIKIHGCRNAEKQGQHSSCCVPDNLKTNSLWIPDSRIYRFHLFLHFGPDLVFVFIPDDPGT